MQTNPSGTITPLTDAAVHTAHPSNTATHTASIAVHTAHPNAAETVKQKSARLKGITGQLAENITRNWLIDLRETNPAILDMLKERDLLPYREMLAWLGEFPGKYITGAYYIYRLTLDEPLRAYLLQFLDELMDCQAEDGYLGPFSKECRLTGSFSQKPQETEGTWDAWGHYHIMFGMLLWYEETKDPRYLQCVERAAGLFLQLFYRPETGRKSLLELKSSESNLSPIHAFAMLYRITGKQCYLDFALEIERDLSDARAGNYIQCALKGIEFYQCPQPRWESLHVILGLAELYRATGKAYYLETVEQIYRSIQKTDIHNTGAFSTDEQAIGTPFKSGSIETCCVIAYNALGVELYKLTGDTKILDFLELSHYNACMGAWSPTGRWSTYHTPMVGDRCASYHINSFQSRPGSPELNCCSVNAPRGIGMLSEWMLTRMGSVLCINAYEDGDYVTEEDVHIRIEGGYPARNQIEILVENYTGDLALRIPGWSVSTALTAGGNAIPATAGAYCRLSCSGNISLSLTFDFSTRYLEGMEEYDGCVSIYRGPILFGTDVRLAGGHNLLDLPVLNREEINNTPSREEQGRIRIPLSCGVTLGDFYHLGNSGCRYTTWLRVESYTHENANLPPAYETSRLQVK